MEIEKAIERYKKIKGLREKGLTFEKIGKEVSLSGYHTSSLLRQGEPKAKKCSGCGNKIEIVSHNFCLKCWPVDLNGRDYTRSIVRIRDNHTCQDCGLKRTTDEVKKHNEKIEGLKGRMKSLDVHHVDGYCGENSRGYDSVKDVDILITLCHKCHFNRHDRSKKIDTGSIVYE